MAKAIEALRAKKIGLKKAIKTFNVPRSTFKRLAKAKYGSPVEASRTNIGRPTVLNEALENELVEYCLAMKASFFGLTRTDLQRMTLQLAVRNNLKHPFGDDMAGRKWVKPFLKRHQARLSERKHTGTSYSRALGFSKENVEVFFDHLMGLYEKENYTSDRIFNVD